MMARREARQVLLREPEQTHRRRQTLAVLRVRRVFELFLKMHESAGGLDQSLEEIRVARFGLEPKLLEDIVRFVIALFVPATEERAIKRVICDVCLVRIHIATTHLSHQLRNPLAFVHGKPNLLAAQIMSKLALNSFSERKNRLPQAGELWQQAWLRHPRR
jgi:hypothetical protein